MQTQAVVQTVKQNLSKTKQSTAISEVLKEATLISVWERSSWVYADRIALYSPHSSPAVKLTYGRLYKLILDFAGGLQTLGLEPGDRIAIIADNSPQWLIADQGSLFAGLINVPRSATASLPELEYILQHSGSRTVIVQDVKTWRRLREGILNLQISRVILLSNEIQEGCISFEALLQQGQGRYVQPNLTRAHLATLMYTSGTTGRPKGVMLTHGNLMHQVENLDVVLQPHAGERALSILPPWHCYERSCEYFLLSKGCTIVYTDRRYLKEDLQIEAPHYLIAVPRIWELLYERIYQQIGQKSPFIQRVVRVFLKFSEIHILQQRFMHGQLLVDGESHSRRMARWQRKFYALMHRLGDRLVYQKIRDQIAPRMRVAITGGSTLPPYLDLFYEILGITILNGYGLTETAPVVAARRANCNVRGTVGPALPFTEIRIVHPETQASKAIGEKGVVMVRGPQVMAGYYNNPEATTAILSEDGWLNTGDLGYLTPDGMLVITGRAKDTIVLSNGENIEPEPLEDACRQSPYISQIVIVGQDQKRLAALVYPDEMAIALWLEQQQLSAMNAIVYHESINWQQSNLLVTAATIANAQVSRIEATVDPTRVPYRINALIREELTKRIHARPGYRPIEQITDFRFVPEPFSPENGLTTQTLKIRRDQVIHHYADLIAEMYGRQRM